MEFLGYQKIGGFAWTYNKKQHFADLYKLTDYDSQYYKPVGLNNNEMLFRYTTDLMKRMEEIRLVKINVETNRIYFLTDLGVDNDTALFETRGIKLNHLTIWKQL